MIRIIRRLFGLSVSAIFLWSFWFDENLVLPSDQKSVIRMFGYPGLVLIPKTR